ncbi:hypothetical protein HDU97_003254, partial [Phlyctochytrium planicorne]
MLWRHYVVHSSLPSVSELNLFYEYITNPETGKVEDFVVNQIKPKGEPVISTRRMNLLPPSVPEKDPNTSASAPAATPSSGISPLFYRKAPAPPPLFSGYIIGPENPDSPGLLSTPEEKDLWGAKTLYLGKDRKECKVIAYQFEEETTIVLFCDKAEDPTSEPLHQPEYYQNLRSMLHSRLPNISPSIGDAWLKSKRAFEAQENPYRYLFFNGINLAVRTSIGASKSTTLSADVIQSITKLHAEMEKLELSEVVLKGSGDLWVAGQRFANKSLYLVLPKGDALLTEIG